MLIELEENLKNLGLSKDQLTWLAILVGTDYAPGGVKGIGPKKGLTIVRQHSSAEAIFTAHQLENWKEIQEIFKTMPVTDDYEITFKPVDRKKVYEFLVEQHDFNKERVEKTLDQIAPAKQQKGLGEFL